MVKKKLISQVEVIDTAAQPAVVEEKKTRRKSFVLDLHIHSPAALGYYGIEGMDSAPALIRLARVKGIDALGITDFFSGAYIDRLNAAAAGTEITVFPGVTLRCELGSCDDVMLCALFPEGTTGKYIEETLEILKVPAEARGKEQYLLTTPFGTILSVIEERGGVVLPSRMDKTPHRLSIIRQLVEDYGFRTFDLAYLDSNSFFKRHWPKNRFNLFSFSDARALAQVGSRIAKVKLPELSFDALSAVMHREGTDAAAPLIVEQEEVVSLTTE